MPAVVLFDGQGSAPASPDVLHQHVLHDAGDNLPLAAVFLHSCRAIFSARLHALPDHDFVHADLPRTACPIPTADPLLLANPLVAIPNLYVVQILRYLAVLDADPVAVADPDFVGFSSGVLPALAAACSDGAPAVLRNATALFAFVFQIGFRCQCYRSQALSDVPSHHVTRTEPWSLVLFGIEADHVQGLVDNFNSHPRRSPLNVSAVTAPACVSISGRPDALAAFRAQHLPPGATARPAGGFTLYHSARLHPTKAALMADLARAPLPLALKHRLRSTATGAALPLDLPPTELLERVLDMILIHPVRFDRVARALAASAPPALRIVNIGPGGGLARTLARALPLPDVSLDDRARPGPADAPGALPLSPQSPRLRMRLPLARASPAAEPIAIVGMAVDLPGAPDAAALWRVLEQGLNMVTEIPGSRFDVSAYAPGAGRAPRTMKTRFGNFIDDAAGFDHALFRISPREARSMDPQQRVLLRCALHALEAAGYVPGATPSSDPDACGVWVGAATADYVQNLRAAVDVHYTTGTLPAFLAGRVSHALGLSGPAVVVNTACSSSVVAIYQACRALAARDCAAALAGGVNVVTSPDMYLGLDRAHFLSPTGQCKPFDASADGYCRAEGCGMFVLKRLSDALADGDAVLGVIRSAEVNQSSAAHSITHPHAPTQARLVTRVLAAAGAHPHAVGVVEAHGTGTQAGDPAEMSSLRTALCAGRSDSAPLHVTSLKANIGHAEAASGAAGLAKLLLMLRHEAIPPQIGLHTLNPKIAPLGTDGARIATERVPWPRAHGRPRLALLNNFGAAGSNAALLLEEAPLAAPGDPARVHTEGDAVLVALSADSERALLALRAAYAAHAAGLPAGAPLVDFGHTATARRRVRAWRMAVAADTPAALAAALRAAAPARAARGAGKTVFVFAGQGGARVGMGRELYRVSGVYARAVDACHAQLVAWGYPGVRAVLNPPESEGGDAGSGLGPAEEMQAGQAALFVLEYALLQLWLSWGLVPDAVVGHSLGEYAAMVAAGVCSVDTALRLVAFRARLMAEKCTPGASGMLAVRLAPQDALDAITSVNSSDELAIACYNGAADVVVGGPREALAALQAHLAEKGGVKTLGLAVPLAFHTAAMDPILEDLTTYARTLAPPAPPTIPIVSNVLGRTVHAGDAAAFDATYFARHCREPVRFADGVADLRALPGFGPVDVWLELGPHPTTLPMLAPLAPGARALHSLHRKTSPRTSLAAALAALHPLRDDIRWRAVYAELYPDARVADAPLYPFAPTQHWVPFREEEAPAAAPAAADDTAGPHARFPFLGAWTQRPALRDGNISEFETPIARIAPFIEGHRVGGVALCPASVYYELALAAATCTMEQLDDSFAADVLTLSEVQFTHPLVHADGAAANARVVVRTTINLHPPGGKHAGTFTISSGQQGNDGSSTVHCTGFIERRARALAAAKLQLHRAGCERRRASVRGLPGGPPPETYHTRTIYDLVFPRVVQYSKAYQVIQAMTLDGAGAEAVATVQLPPDHDRRGFAVQPVFVDALLHAAGFVINRGAQSSEVYICSQVDSAKLLLGALDYAAPYEVFCSTAPLQDGLVLADAWAVEAGGAMRVVAHLKRMRFSRLRTHSLHKLLSYAARSPDAPGPSPAPAPKKCAAPPRRPIQKRASISSSEKTVVDSGAADVIAGEVFKLVASICDVPLADLDMHSSLADLGVDSLMWIELIGHLRTMPWAAFADASKLMVSGTVGELVGKLAQRSWLPKMMIAPDGQAMRAFGGASKVSVVDEVPPAPKELEAPVQAKDVLSKVLEIPVDELNDDDDFDQLGLDSLASIEALHALQAQFCISLPPDFFRTYSTIGAVQTFIGHATVSRASSRSSCSKRSGDDRLQRSCGADKTLLQIQRSPTNATPLFLVHDGSGLGFCYSRIGLLGRPVWSFNNPRLLSGEHWEGGVPEMALQYSNLIMPTVTDAGCVLGGWSFGGVVAFHMACELLKAGVKVAGVVLIDSPSPFTHTPLPDALIDAVIQSGEHCMQQSRIVELARVQMQHSTRALVDYDPAAAATDPAHIPRLVMIRCSESFDVRGVAGPACAPMPFLEDRSDPKSAVADWERLVGREVPVLDIPGHHFAPFHAENIPALSQRLNEAIALLEEQTL